MSSASSPPSMKILTIGPPKGQITNLISKVSAINAKHGPFHALFVLGDFFTGSDELNAEETALIEAQSSLPMRTYVYQGRQRPPARIRDLITTLDKGKRRRRDDEDQVPLKISHNLYWMGQNQVNWVPREGPPDHDDDVVDEQGHRLGLRVAVCGGVWDPERWAKEVQSPGGADQLTADEVEHASAYILPSQLERLYRHPALQATVIPQANGTAAKASSSSEPQSLAEARAQFKAQQQTDAATASASAVNTQPMIDLVLLPTWPSGVSLFSKTFPPAGAPEEARTWGLPPMAEVMRRARPRYGFAIAPDAQGANSDAEWAFTGVFWEREPYRSSGAATAATASAAASGSNAVTVQQQQHQRITRFISLANFANAKKVRWFLALNLAIGQGSPDASAVKAATQSPFGDFGALSSGPAAKRKADDGTNGGVDGQGLSSEVNFRWQQKKPRTDGKDSNPPMDDGPPPEGYICKICGSREHYIRLCPHKTSRAGNGNGNLPSGSGLPNRPEGAEEALGPRTRREPVQMVGPQDCWFCLSNAGCAKHLVVAIGEESYLALPKGQLPPAASEASPVPGGGHVLLIPVAHTTSIQSYNGDSSKLSTEMEAYLEALRKCYEAHDCILVAWDIVKHSNTRAGHFQIQIVPVPQARMVASGAPPFEDALRHEAQQRGYALQEVIDPDTKRLGSNDARAEYFEVHILSSPQGRVTYRVDLAAPSRGRFDYQFARTLLAQYLGVPDRADWRRCVSQSTKVEEAETRSFREAFKEWMPTFGEDDDSDSEDEE